MTSVRVVWALALLSITGAWVAGSYDLATGSAAAAQTMSPGGATPPAAPGDNMARLAERLNERGTAMPAASLPSDPNVDRARDLATAANQAADRVLTPQGVRSSGSAGRGIEVAQAASDDVIESGRTTFREIWRRLHSDTVPPVAAPTQPAAKPAMAPAPTVSAPSASTPATTAKPGTTAQVPAASKPAATPPVVSVPVRSTWNHQQGASYGDAHRQRSRYRASGRGTGSSGGDYG